MEINKIGKLDNLTPTQPRKINSGVGSGPSFREALEKTNTQGSVQGGVGLGTQLKSTDAVKFSNHAIERMQARGISFNPQDLVRLTDAIGRAAAKGSKDSLILMNDSALIVSVKNNTVVTVMDKNALKENVFTNIDSTIVM